MAGLMGGLAGAWIVGMGIVGWRQVRSSGHLPVPAALLAVTGLFAGMALLADISPRARPVITLVAWGLDVAGLFRVLPAGLFGEVQTAAATEAAAQPPLTATTAAAPTGFTNTAPITTAGG